MRRSIQASSPTGLAHSRHHESMPALSCLDGLQDLPPSSGGGLKDVPCLPSPPQAWRSCMCPLPHFSASFPPGSVSLIPLIKAEVQSLGHILSVTGQQQENTENQALTPGSLPVSPQCPQA